MNNLDNEWEELKSDEKDSLILPKKPKKVKFLADQNIPIKIVQELRNAKISIATVEELGLEGCPDENLVQIARKRGLVILTTDRDFWDERKHPIHKCFGIICIDAGPQDSKKILESIALIDVFFLRYIPREWWDKQKALIKSNGFVLRQIIYNGSIEDNEYMFQRGKVYIRKPKK
jgi:predicted nuclease of predicted toxin-antitoxin system